nr:cobalamin-dependent protein [Desulfobulbaceae bacterium]
MIFLVNPYITSAERYGKDIGDIGGHQMPLGIFYLAAALEKAGEDVCVMDCESLNVTHEEFISKVKELNGVIVGITSTTVGFYRARSLAEMLRKTIPGIHIIIGGPHMSAMPEQTMQTGVFDYGITHEGETPLTKLVSFLLHQKGELANVPNLYYLENGIQKTGRMEYIQDMDSIPLPARHLSKDLSIYKPPVGAYREKPVMNMLTSRGCPYHCIFCDNNTFGRKTRFFSAEYVVNEIKQLIFTYGAKEIAFLDDTFVLDKKRLRKIFELLDADNIHFPWTCMTRVNNLDFETLEFMSNHGCWQIRIGIESGNQKVIDFIKKGITLEQVRNVANWSNSLRIKVSGFFIIGHHIDTPKTIQDTIEFALSIPLTDIIATINTPIPGTESYKLAKQYGDYQEDDWLSLNYWTPIFVPHGLTKEFMLKKQVEMYSRFYRRPAILLKQLQKIKSWQECKLYIHNAYLGAKFLIKGNN